MKLGFGNISFFDAVLHQYQRWSSQLFVYSTSLLVATSTALILDIRFHWSPARVMLYVLPLTVLLLVAVPMLRVMASSLGVLKSSSYPESIPGDQLTYLPDVLSQHGNRRAEEFDRLRKLIAAINQELDRLHEMVESEDSSSDVRQKLKEAKRNLR